MKFKDTVVIVTGASTGIGRSCAIAFAAEGANVVLVARSKEGLQETKNKIESLRGKAEVFSVDLSDSGQIHQFIQKIKTAYSHIDVLLNIAGIWHGADEVYSEKEYETFDEHVIIDTYFVGVIAPSLLAHGFIPVMPKGSSIINVSGTFESGAKGWLPYFVSKRAIEDLTIGLAQELKDKGIRVNAISPSDTATDAYMKFFPQYIEEAIEPNEIATFAVHLYSHDSENITGEIFVMKKDEKPTKSFHV